MTIDIRGDSRQYLGKPFVGKPQSPLFNLRLRQQMFRAGHKERRKKINGNYAISRSRESRGAQKLKGGWRARTWPTGTNSLSLSFSLSHPSVSRLCFRTVPEADAFVRWQWRDCLASSTFLPTIRRFLRDLSSQAFRWCLLTKTLPQWRRFSFLSLISANGITASYRWPFWELPSCQVDRSN